MSLLSGILNGGAFTGSLGKGIDPSHYPFKRSRRRPGGPGETPSEETKQWECRWDKPYVQICKNTETGYEKKVKVKRKYKKKYNKAYRGPPTPPGGKYPRGSQFKRKTARPGAKYRPPSKKWVTAETARKRKSARKGKVPRKGRKS